ncbi:MAG: helix-turn-helix transcriptional regulator [Clostridia bacterium]|nr:helix-turn-helix transcriptional regulator [Clostridia bacterium]
MDYKLLGEKVTQYRRQMNMTQQQLADRTRLSTETIGRIEKGKTKLSLENAVLLAKGMGVSLDALTDESTSILYPNAKNDSELLHARALLEKANRHIEQAMECLNEKPIHLHWFWPELSDKE